MNQNIVSFISFLNKDLILSINQLTKLEIKKKRYLINIKLT